MIPRYQPPREIGHVLIPDKTKNLNTIATVLSGRVTRTTPPPTVDQPVSFTTRSTLRHKDDYATMTLVINTGSVPVIVYENNIAVGVAPVGGNLTITPGKGLIEGEGIGEAWSASVTVRTTHAVTPRGDYPAAVEPDPVGSFLL